MHVIVNGTFKIFALRFTYAIVLRIHWHASRGLLAWHGAGTHTGNFTFATVAGAGHMAPTFKPPQALALLKRFLANQPL